jgi:hypothetical protein
VPPELHYPDVVTPLGWPYYRQGMQIRVVPPGSTLEGAEATIVISPLVPRAGMPEPDEIVESAIFAEARHRLEIVTQKGPMNTKGAEIDGIYYEVTGYVRPQFPREKRIYVMYSDSLCYYAISYLAPEATFERHVETFWKVARSIKPFRGAVIMPSGPSPLAIIYSD